MIIKKYQKIEVHLKPLPILKKIGTKPRKKTCDPRLFSFDPLHFTLDPRLFTLDPRLFTLNPRHLTLDTRPSTKTRTQLNPTSEIQTMSGKYPFVANFQIAFLLKFALDYAVISLHTNTVTYFVEKCLIFHEEINKRI